MCSPPTHRSTQDVVGHNIEEHATAAFVRIHFDVQNVQRSLDQSARIGDAVHAAAEIAAGEQALNTSRSDIGQPYEVLTWPAASEAPFIDA
jgi:hypothetical protein